MFKKLLLSLLIAVPLVAQAEWIELDETDESLLLVNLDRTIATYPSLQYAETWVKEAIHTDKRKDGLGVGDFRMVKMSFKCNSNEYGLAALYHYKKTGKVIYSQELPYVTYKSVPPDSNGESLLYQVCNYVYGESE